MGRHGGHDAGLLSRHGPDAGKELLHRQRLGTWGFKATPVCGLTMAHTIANDSAHDLIKPFYLDRFVEYAQVGEKGAASVGH